MDTPVVGRRYWVDWKGRFQRPAEVVAVGRKWIHVRFEDGFEARVSLATPLREVDRSKAA